MKYGTSFPQDGLLADPVATRDFAQAVEDLDYDFLTGSDRVLDKNPKAVRREPFVLLGYLAACTQRIELGTSIVIAPQRQTALVAKQMAEIDVLSGGRVHIGIGIGYQELEFQALNENIHNRGRRVEEQIEVMRLLWTQPTVTFHGKWHHIEGLGITMRPKQQPIPVWMGGTVEAALRRIARIADGWIPPFATGDDIAKTIDAFRGYAGEIGRDLTGFPIKGRFNITDSTPEDWVRNRDDWEKAGATHFAISLNDSGFTTLDQHIALLRSFKEAVW